MFFLLRLKGDLTSCFSLACCLNLQKSLVSWLQSLASCFQSSQWGLWSCLISLLLVGLLRGNDWVNLHISSFYPLFFISFFLYLFVCLFIYLWLCWVLVSVRGLSLVAASGGHSSSRCAGLSLSRPLLLWSTGSRRAGSAIVAHGPSHSAACGILPDQGSNPCPLHWQADSQPLHHQGSPFF